MSIVNTAKAKTREDTNNPPITFLSLSGHPQALAIRSSTPRNTGNRCQTFDCGFKVVAAAITSNRSG